MNFLKLIRYQNLLLLASMQLLFRYGFLNLQKVPLALNNWQYFLLVLSTILLAAAGYVIDNIFNRKSNNTYLNISETTTYNIYIGLNITGVIIGFYLSNIINKPSFATLFIFVAATLYYYATTLKHIMILGNLVIALLLAFSIIIIGIFDLYPVTYIQNQMQMKNLFSILFDYSVFVFLITFIREIVTGIENINDYNNQKRTTLPIAIGINKTSKIVFLLTFIPLITLLLYVNNNFVKNDFWIVTGYVFLFILAPLLLFIFKITTAKNNKEFHQLSSLLKWILFFGILSIGVISFNLMNYA